MRVNLPINTDTLCEVCRRRKRIQKLKYRAVCQHCYAKEKTCCVRCGLSKHFPPNEANLCPRCTKLYAGPQAVCGYCAELKVIFDQEAGLCKRCFDNKLIRESRKPKQIKVECAVCGKLRSSAILGRSICTACYTQERNGRGLCGRCGKEKVILIKEGRLCKRCYAGGNAAKELRGYVKGFTTPYIYNKTLFNLLLTTFDRNAATEKIVNRVRAFGRFLQTHQFNDPLTWQAIEDALPVLGPTNRNVPKMVRSCLYDIGHLMVEKGELETREVFIAKRRSFLPLRHAPEHIKTHLSRYASWLYEQKYNPRTVWRHLSTLAAFWMWCEKDDVLSPAKVRKHLIEEYVQTLYWQWRCSTCGHKVLIELGEGHDAPQICKNCAGLHTLYRDRRYDPQHAQRLTTDLWTFFDWAKFNRLTIFNPVPRAGKKIRRIIRHYSPEVIQKLCAYIRRPDSDPVEALVLYLVVFWACTYWDLRHAEIPQLTQDKAAQPGLSEAYCIVLSPRPRSIRRKSSGRRDGVLEFPPIAAAWLKPLLKRFEHHRQRVLKTPVNQYLIVAEGRARHNTPVCDELIRRIVRRATYNALEGVYCSLNGVRQTAAVMYADNAGSAILEDLGWSSSRTVSYVQAPREIILPSTLPKTPVRL